jgi:valyl-tRNA synthetase
VERAVDAPSAGAVTAVLAIGRVVLPMAGLLDLEAERSRLCAQLEKLEREAARSEDKLASEGFTRRAPAGIVARERERVAELSDRLRAVRESLARLA